MITEFDKRAMAYILAGHGTWFTAHLLRLCSKADSSNLERIRLGFPDVVEAFEAYHNGPDEETTDV